MSSRERPAKDTASGPTVSASIGTLPSRGFSDVPSVFVRRLGHFKVEQMNAH